MSALGRRRPEPGATRYNTTTSQIEVYVASDGWTPVVTSTATYASATPPPGPSGVSRSTPSLPYVIETVNSLMQDMDNEQLDDLIDAALEELRVRGKGKFPE